MSKAAPLATTNGGNGASATTDSELARDKTSGTAGGGPTVPPADTSSSSSGSVRGEVLDLAADLRNFRPGDRLNIPYELTVSESLQEFWQSAFHSQDRINTSR